MRRGSPDTLRHQPERQGNLRLRIGHWHSQGGRALGCSGAEPKDDRTPRSSASTSSDSHRRPESLHRQPPRIFADPATGAISGSGPRRPRPGTQKTSVTNQCHDITVFPEVSLLPAPAPKRILLIFRIR